MTRTWPVLLLTLLAFACDGEGECDRLVEDAKEAALIDAPDCDFMVSIGEEVCDVGDAQSAAPREGYLDIFCRDASSTCILTNEEIVNACD